MSWQASTAVLKHSQSKGSMRLLLLAMSNYAGADGSGVYPSVASLVDDTKLEERTVRYLLRGLEEMGEIRCDVRGGGRGRTSQWTITLPGIGGVPARESDVTGTCSERGKTLPLLSGDQRGTPEQEKGHPGVGKGAKSGLKGARAIAPEHENNHENNHGSSSAVAGAGPALPDDDDEKPRKVLELYEELIGRAHRKPDVPTAKKLAVYPLEAVRVGIEESIKNARASGTKFKFLGYCVDEIETAALWYAEQAPAADQRHTHQPHEPAGSEARSDPATRAPAARAEAAADSPDSASSDADRDGGLDPVSGDDGDGRTGAELGGNTGEMASQLNGSAARQGLTGFGAVPGSQGVVAEASAATAPLLSPAPATPAPAHVPPSVETQGDVSTDIHAPPPGDDTERRRASTIDGLAVFRERLQQRSAAGRHGG